METNQKGKGLRELLASRNKWATSKEVPKSKVPPSLPPPPPPPPTDFGLKVITDLKKKRPVLDLEEGELGPQKGDQATEGVQRVLRQKVLLCR